MNIKTVMASVFRVLAIMLVLTVLLPSVLKLTHAFTHHKHEVCDTDNKHETHFHESDLNCDFYKFKLTKTQFFENYQELLYCSWRSVPVPWQNVPTRMRGPYRLQS